MSNTTSGGYNCVCGLYISPYQSHTCQYNSTTGNTSAGLIYCVGCARGIGSGAQYINGVGPYCQVCAGGTGIGVQYINSLTGTNLQATGVNSSYINTWNTPSILEEILGIRNITGEKGKCSCCKNEVELVLSYKVIRIERKICSSCLLQRVDNLLGIDSSAKLENILYGK